MYTYVYIHKRQEHNHTRTPLICKFMYRHMCTHTGENLVLVVCGNDTTSYPDSNFLYFVRFLHTPQDTKTHKHTCILYMYIYVYMNVNICICIYMYVYV